jgi:hypothetical protein
MLKIQGCWYVMLYQWVSIIQCFEGSQYFSLQDQAVQEQIS